MSQNSNRNRRSSLLCRKKSYFYPLLESLVAQASHDEHLCQRNPLLDALNAVISSSKDGFSWLMEQKYSKVFKVKNSVVIF